MKLNYLKRDTVVMKHSGRVVHTLLANSRMKSDCLAPICSTLSQLPSPWGCPLGGGGGDRDDDDTQGIATYLCFGLFNQVSVAAGNYLLKVVSLVRQEGFT